MAKEYWLRFNSAVAPTSTSGLSPTFISFVKYDGTTLTPPGITQPLSGVGLYKFEYSPSFSIAFVADGATTGLDASVRYIVGALDPADSIDERTLELGSTQTAQGTALAAQGSTLTGVGNSLSVLAVGSSLSAMGSTLTGIGNSASVLAVGSSLNAIGSSVIAMGSSLVAMGSTLTGIGNSMTVLSLEATSTAIGSTLTSLGAAQANMGATLVGVGNTSITLGTLGLAQGASLATQLTSLGSSVSVLSLGSSLNAMGSTISGMAATLLSIGTTLIYDDTALGNTLLSIAVNIGTPSDTFGTSSVDPVSLFGHVRRVYEDIEGQQEFNKATGVWTLKSRGGSLITTKTMTNTALIVSKT